MRAGAWMPASRDAHVGGIINRFVFSLFGKPNSEGIADEGEEHRRDSSQPLPISPL
jgi:hypothetical protein